MAPDPRIAMAGLSLVTIFTVGDAPTEARARDCRRRELKVLPNREEPAGPASLSRRASRRAAGDDQPIEPEQDHRPDQCHHKARALTWAIQSHRPPEPAAEHRTHDAEHDGDDDPARVAPRHHQLGDGAYH